MKTLLTFKFQLVIRKAGLWIVSCPLENVVNSEKEGRRNEVLLEERNIPDFDLYLSTFSDTFLTDSFVDVKLNVLMNAMGLCVENENQLDATEWFIALIICSTCFGHFCAHHQELKTVCVLLLSMVCDALVAGCRRSGAGQPAMCSG